MFSIWTHLTPTRTLVMIGNMIIPAPLNHGDTIGTMSPSSFITKEDLDKAVTFVKDRGYNVSVHPQTLAKHHQSAGTDEQKRDAFHDLVRDPEIKAIIFSAGGNRALHWVDQIDFDLVRANPKIIMGFSDCTVPLNMITEKTGLVTYHGPNLRWFMVHPKNTQDIAQCFDVLHHPDKAHHFSTHMNGALIGGNMSLMQYLLDDLDFNDKILFLEGWNTETSYLDRMFAHFRRRGVFETIQGLIIGQFDNLTDTGRPYGFTLDDMIEEHVPNHIPIIRNAPFGHGDRLITLPIGLEN